MLFLLLLNADVAIYFFLSDADIAEQVVPETYDRNDLPQLL